MIKELEEVNQMLIDKIDEYYDMYDIIYAKDTVLDTSDMGLYNKRPQEVGYLKLTDVFPVNSLIEIRTAIRN